MTIFDRKIPIHETPEGSPPIEKLLPKLGRMFDKYEVSHSFAYPTRDEQDSAWDDKSKTLHCWLYYESGQNTEVTLILALFIKNYLHDDDTALLEAITKSMSKALVSALASVELDGWDPNPTGTGGHNEAV